MTPFLDVTEAKGAIREKVVTLAARRGVDARALTDADVIPESGALDSLAILQLIEWFELTFELTIAQSDLTLENFGTIDAMASYYERSRARS